MPRVEIISRQPVFRRDYKRLFKDQFHVSCYSTLRDGLGYATKSSIDILIIDTYALISIETKGVRADDSWYKKLSEVKNLNQGEMGILFLMPDEPDFQTALRPIFRKLESETVDVFSYQKQEISQPFFLEDLHSRIMKLISVLEMRRSMLLLQQENNVYINMLSHDRQKNHIFTYHPPCSFLSGLSDISEKFRNKLMLASRSEDPVLIITSDDSETEHIARYMHSIGNNPTSNFYSLDFRAIPKHLHAARLFGYARPNHSSQKGAFELAANGTLLLANIQSMSWDLQGELLRTMEKNEFEKAISPQKKKQQCHLILSADTDLGSKVENDSFRQDLYYKVQMLPIYVPTLQERKDDIPGIIEEYTRWYSAKVNRKAEITPQIKKLFMKRDWPKGVAQLYTALGQVLQMKEYAQNGAEIDLTAKVNPPETNFLREKNGTLSDSLFKELVTKPRLTLEDLEREYIQRVIDNHKGNMSESARLLGISRKTLYDKVKKYSLVKKTS